MRPGAGASGDRVPGAPAAAHPVRGAPLLGPFHDTIDEWLRADLTAPAKQRHTVQRITNRLNTEFGASVGYSTVRDYVAVRRRQIVAQATGRVDQVEAVNGFVPRHNRAGQDAEVDFGEVWVRIAGQMTKCHLFVLRLSYSGKAVHRIILRTTDLEGLGFTVSRRRLWLRRVRR